MDLQTLQTWVSQSNSIAFFGGAGVSTESGVPDFRSTDGLYNQQYRYPPETILSHTFFVNQPEEFFRFYRNKMLYLDARPNAAHKALAGWEHQGKQVTVITQNIDGLHQAAGSKKVLELHGSVHRNHCMNCGASYSADFIRNSSGIPRCSCGGIVKPDVVLYEEALNSAVMQMAAEAIEQADLLIVGGTSLSVYPAAGFIQYYSGNRLVLINQSQTPYDAKADLLLRGKIGKILSQIS